MTNNPFKLKCLMEMGIKVLSRIPMLAAPNVHSLAYLKAKAHRMSHLLHQLDDVEVSTAGCCWLPADIDVVGHGILVALCGTSMCTVETGEMLPNRLVLT